MKRVTLACLANLQTAVDHAEDPVAQADIAWKRRRNSKPRQAAFADVDATLRAMARGRTRCMYCEDSRGSTVDHFRPKALYPGVAFVWTNHVLSCSHCNSNEKRAEFPLDGEGNRLLIDPTDPKDDPTSHLALVPETGMLVELDAMGKATERVFGLNRHDELTFGRRDAWSALERIVADIDARLGENDLGAVRRLVAEAKRLSFQSVVHHFVRDALSPRPSFVRRRYAQIIAATAEHWVWAR